MSNVDVHCDNGAVRIIVRERPVRDAQGFEEDSSSVISYLEGTRNVLIFIRNIRNLLINCYT